MGKPRLQDVLETIRTACEFALEAAGIPNAGQVVVGQPVGTELIKILGQPDAQWQATIYPFGDARSTVRYWPEWYQYQALPAVPLVATVAGNVVTFSGSTVAGLNVHTFVGAPLRDAYYQTRSADTPALVATAVATAVNVLGPPLSASASGARVTISGSPALRVNIGSSGETMIAEVRREERAVQVSVWASDPDTRYLIADPFLAALGNTLTPFLTLSDGTSMRVAYQTDRMQEDAQSSYSLYEHHIVLLVEYGIVQTAVGASVESIGATSKITTVETTLTIGGS